MLSRKNTDDQILYESFANYYYENGCSYDGLEIPKSLVRKAKKYIYDLLKELENGKEKID